MKIPLSKKEVDFAINLAPKTIYWKPKPGDWFVDLNSLKVLYTGEYEQSVSLCLVIDEDGRSFSYLELLIDSEENGNRMKKSLSLSESEKISKMHLVPSIKDCINLMERIFDHRFKSLERHDSFFEVSAINLNNGKKISATGETEILAFYNLIECLDYN